MVSTREIQETVTPYLTALYTVASLVFHQIATLSFSHFNFAFGQSLFSIGSLGVSAAAIVSVAVPAGVYFLNDNHPREWTTQTYLTLIPVSSATLMWLSPPLMGFVTGSAFLTWVVFGVNLAAVGIVAGDNYL